MASIVLSAAGATIGSTAAASIGASAAAGGMIGRAAGKFIGGAIDSAIFGADEIRREGHRLADLSVQVSTYGKVIPQIYGTVRLAGNVIWSMPIKETVTTSTSSAGGGKGGGGAKVTTTNYSYSVTLAIAICEGEIDEVTRVWADAKLLDYKHGTYRIYRGTETQLPDPFIESIEGVGKTPAYRGLAYVVIEDFPLADFGNRIPNFTFEVKKSVKTDDYNGQAVEEMIDSVVMIPGAGEFVYDTQKASKVTGVRLSNGDWVQSGYSEAINIHNPNLQANALESLDNLEKICPNTEWISVVVNWFGNSLDAGQCEIRPAVEFKDGAVVAPEDWSVAGYSRENAVQISLDANGSPNYGGTPDDNSIVRYVTELKNRGYKVALLPMFFMDLPDKPWRGRLTGSAADVAAFFTKDNGYNAFINHYATLLAGKLDAFIIGSELIGLTKVTESAGVYPAVDALISLAASVRAAQGSEVIITYAADWSEYHHTDGGWYNLDPLWADSNIDVIGIDAYFPLTDMPQREMGYSVDNIIAGWTSGEGYDWYYSDEERTVKTPLDAQYAWKNMEWWWKNSHVNPDGVTTAWVPQSKKIWFCEYGFPSVDGATNQPNIFYDPNSSEGGLPHHSEGRVDFYAQRVAITATLAKWSGSNMVERMFLWTWDARPYPYYPDRRDVWSDGSVWATGHWVCGKLGVSSLAGIVRDICVRAGLSPSRLDVTRLNRLVYGYVMSRQHTARESLEVLMQTYFFDMVERDGVLVCIPRGNNGSGDAYITDISEDKLLSYEESSGSEVLQITRIQELELPRKVDVIYLDRLDDYQPSTQSATREAVGDAVSSEMINLPLVMPEAEAKAIADTILATRWLSRTRYRFWLNIAFAGLEPSDIVRLNMGDGNSYVMRIVNLIADRGKIRIDAIQEDVSIYDIFRLNIGYDSEVLGRDTVSAAANSGGDGYSDNVATKFEILDLPLLPDENGNDSRLYFANVGQAANWQGAALYSSSDGGENYHHIMTDTQSSIIGTVTYFSPETMGANAVRNAASQGYVFDDKTVIEVAIIGDGELSGTTRSAVLNGANSALVGDEIIQFTNVELIGNQHYRLSGLLRGRLGTEWAYNTHIEGERFIVLDGSIDKFSMSESLIGLSRDYKAVTIGSTLNSAEPKSYVYKAISAKPYAPVHISASRNSSGDALISWKRRSRTAGEWRDLVDVPLFEESELYEVDIVTGADDAGSEVKRTISANSPQITYSATAQIEDFGSVQQTIYVRVYQISSVVGRGYAGIGIV